MFISTTTIRFALALLFCGLIGEARATALNVVQSDQAVIMLADGAYFGGDARVLAVGSKIELYPAARSVFGCRGMRAVCYQVGRLFRSESSSLENMTSRALAIARAVQEFARDEGTLGDVSAYIAGFPSSNSGGPQVWSIAISAAAVDVVKLRSTQSQFSPALDDPDVVEAIRTGQFSRQPEHFGFRALDLQRRAAVTIPGWNDGRPAHVVGGFAEAAIVTRDSITVKILKRWPDVIGKEIIP